MLFLYGVFQRAGFFFYRFLLGFQFLDFGLAVLFYPLFRQLRHIILVLLFGRLFLFRCLGGRYGRPEVGELFFPFTLRPGFFFLFRPVVQLIDLGFDRLDLPVFFFINEFQSLIVFFIYEFQALVCCLFKFIELFFLCLFQFTQLFFLRFLQRIVGFLIGILKSFILFIERLLQFFILLVV